MLRRIQITTPPARIDELLAEFRGMDGITGIRLERGISEHPKGDLLTLHVMPDTRFDDDPSVGSFVEVHDVLTARGGVRATRTRVR